MMEATLNETVEQVIQASGLRILTDDEPVPEKAHMARVMDICGDYKVVWDPAKPEETEAARAAWDRLKTKGYWGYTVKGKNGEKGEVLDEFDAEAGRLILAPRLVGG